MNDTNVSPTVLSLLIGEFLQIADLHATTDTGMIIIKIDRGVASLRVAEYKTGYEDTLDSRRFGATFSNGAHSFIFDLLNVRKDTDIDARN